VADRDLVPDVWLLTDLLHQSMKELLDVANAVIAPLVATVEPAAATKKTAPKKATPKKAAAKKAAAKPSRSVSASAAPVRMPARKPAARR
jgi:topoisomerase IA-like protein